MEPGYYDNGPPVSQNVAAKYYTRAIAEHRGLDVNLTINSFFQKDALKPVHNINYLLAGAAPVDMPVEIVIAEGSIRHYTFSLPDGDVLLAVWDNWGIVEWKHFQYNFADRNSGEFHDFCSTKGVGHSPSIVECCE